MTESRALGLFLNLGTWFGFLRLWLFDLYSCVSWILHWFLDYFCESWWLVGFVRAPFEYSCFLDLCLFCYSWDDFCWKFAFLWFLAVRHSNKGGITVHSCVKFSKYTCYPVFYRPRIRLLAWIMYLNDRHSVCLKYVCPSIVC